MQNKNVLTLLTSNICASLLSFHEYTYLAKIKKLIGQQNRCALFSSLISLLVFYQRVAEYFDVQPQRFLKVVLEILHSIHSRIIVKEKKRSSTVEILILTFSKVTERLFALDITFICVFMTINCFMFDRFYHRVVDD